MVQKNKMRKSTRRLIKISMLVLAAVLLIGLFVTQPFAVLDTKFIGTQSCGKFFGCGGDKITACENAVEDYEDDGWQCEPCKIWCSNTNEMRARSDGRYDPLIPKYPNPCDVYSGGGALVEARAKCILPQEEAKSHYKTICYNSEEKDHAFSGLKGERGKTYPADHTFIGADRYWYNELEQREERLERCDYACTQVKDLDVNNPESMTKCSGSPEEAEEDYDPTDYKQCFAFAGQWEIWWFDSNDELNERVEVCTELCKDSECVFFDQDTETPTGIENGEKSILECKYGACDSDVMGRCADGSEVLAYKCANGCSEPQTEVCPNGERPQYSFCEAYEVEENSECKFSIAKLVTDKGISAFFDMYKTWILLGAVIIAIIVALLIPIGKKRGLSGLV